MVDGHVDDFISSMILVVSPEVIASALDGGYFFLSIPIIKSSCSYTFLNSIWIVPEWNLLDLLSIESTKYIVIKLTQSRLELHK